MQLLERLRELNERYGTGIPAWRLALEALARKLPPDEIYEWLQRLKVQRRDAERIAWAVTVGPRLVERLRGDAPEPAEIVALAEPSAPDAPLYALALADQEPLREYLERLRDVRLEVMAPISRSSESASRRRSARSSRSCGAASSTVSSTGASPSSRRRES